MKRLTFNTMCVINELYMKVTLMFIILLLLFLLLSTSPSCKLGSGVNIDEAVKSGGLIINK